MASKFSTLSILPFLHTKEPPDQKKITGPNRLYSVCKNRLGHREVHSVPPYDHLMILVADKACIGMEVLRLG